MKRIFVFAFFCLTALGAGAQIVVNNALVPYYIEGASSTNNNRTPFWFWAEVEGLTPGATYHYYTTMDTLNASSTSNGAGNTYLVNTTTGTIRRTANTSMTNNAGYDSLTADSNGIYSGWFGVEPTGNGRFTAGNTVYPKLIMNNGAGGTTVANRVLLPYSVSVLSYGNTTMSNTQGSAIYDSLNAQPKNFICVYDNQTAGGRPISIAIVENDGMDLYGVSSVAAFYKNMVDTLDFHWGTILPNNLPGGIEALEERDFMTGMPIDTVTDADGIWCYGTNTINPSNGNTGAYLNSTYVLSASASIPDTTWTSFGTTFTANATSPNANYNWDFGDGNQDTGAVVINVYANAGVYNVQVIVSTGGCADTINHTIIVLLSTDIRTVPSLWFGTTPNPTTGEIRLTTKDNNTKTITVTNLLGETISTQRMNGNSITLDLSGQQTGLYFIRVKDEVTGRTGIRKIILQ